MWKFLMSNKKKVQLLEGALERLWDGVFPRFAPQKYICDAITAARKEIGYYELRDDEVELIRLISDRLEHNFSLSEWLETKGIPSEDLTHEQVQAHRKAWLLLLIEEFSEKQIEHIDGDLGNNRLKNLREVSCSANLRNKF